MPQLLLNKSPVPITVGESDLIITEEALREGIPELCDRMNWTFAPPPDIAEQPLVRWKVTWLPQTGDTAIVIHACHVLGDGGVIAQMQSTVSDFYQGKAPEWPMPTYEKYFELPPRLPAERFNEVLHKHIPNLINDYDPKTFMEMYQSQVNATERVDLIFSLEQLRLLQRIANEQAGTGNRLSRGDALIAYTITLFNRTYPQPFNQLMNVVHVSHTCFTRASYIFLTSNFRRAAASLLPTQNTSCTLSPPRVTPSSTLSVSRYRTSTSSTSAPSRSLCETRCRKSTTTSS
jgi:hypothetical protein